MGIGLGLGSLGQPSHGGMKAEGLGQRQGGEVGIGIGTEIGTRIGIGIWIRIRTLIQAGMRIQKRIRMEIKIWIGIGRLSTADGY